MSADEIIRTLQLEPLPFEGGYFRLVHKSEDMLSAHGGVRSYYTSIYYLVTPTSFSRMHKLASDEIFHFYLGDPVEMLTIAPDGSHTLIELGSDPLAGHRFQHRVQVDHWQGTILKPGGKFALMGTNVIPGFEEADFIPGERDILIAQYPHLQQAIIERTHQHD